MLWRRSGEALIVIRDGREQPVIPFYGDSSTTCIQTVTMPRSHCLVQPTEANLSWSFRDPSGSCQSCQELFGLLLVQQLGISESVGILTFFAGK